MSEVNDITVFIYESISEIGEEDWEIQQEQLVDFKDKLKDNG